jgi:hypothetical protein
LMISFVFIDFHWFISKAGNEQLAAKSPTAKG